MPTGWWIAVGVVALFLAGAAGMCVMQFRIARSLDGAWKTADGPIPGCDCEDCDQEWVGLMREVARRQAAELDKEKR